MRVHPDHWAAFLDFAERNPSIITNKFVGPNGREKLDALWAEITVILNSLGLGEKTLHEWKKTVIDWKSKTKAKAAGIAKDLCKTGGGPSSGTNLSNCEERLLNIMGRTSAFGDANIPERGLKRKNELDIPLVHINTNKRSESTSTATTVMVNDPINTKSLPSVYGSPVAQLTPIHAPLSSIQTSSEKRLASVELKTSTEKNLKFAKTTRLQCKKNTAKNKIKENVAPIVEAKEAFVNMHDEVVQVLNSININLTSISDSLQDIANSMKEF